MTGQKNALRRIEVNYAGVQSSFWMGVCAFGGFTALYLSYRGFNDTQIGMISSSVAVLTIIFQLLLSSFSDRRPDIPLKRSIAILYVLAIVMAGLLAAIPMPLAMMALIFPLGSGFNATINGLLNALMMQYVNAGIPVNYGWPRGIASIAYALFALLLGSLVERYTPALLMPIFMVVAAIGIVTVLMMPDVYTLSGRKAAPFIKEREGGQTSYRQMLSRAPVFSLFLLASVLTYTGQSGCFLFLVRVVESVGGGGKELGLSMFIQAGIELPIMLLSPVLLKRFKPHNVLTFSFFFYALRALTLALANSIGMVYLAMGLNFFCFGIYGVASVYFVNDLLPAGEKVRAQGLVVLSGSVGGIISSLFSGMIIDRWGLKTMLLLSALVAGMGFLVMLVAAARQTSFDRIRRRVIGYAHRH